VDSFAPVRHLGIDEPNPVAVLFKIILILSVFFGNIFVGVLIFRRSVDVDRNFQQPISVLECL